MKACPAFTLTVALQPGGPAGPIVEDRLDLQVRRINGKTCVACQAGDVTVLLNQPEALAVASALGRLATHATDIVSPREEAVEGPPPGRHDVSSRSLYSIQWSTRVQRVFTRAGFKTVGDMLAQMPAGLLALRNFGFSSYHEVCRKLEEVGIGLPANWRAPPPRELKRAAGH
jgi:hypothetical protein